MKKNLSTTAMTSLKWLAIAGMVASLGACGGSDNPPPPVTGKVADGYLTGATVTLDVNDDRICGGSDPTTTSDSDGDFRFSATQNPGNGSHMVCATGGKDLSTGLLFVGQMKAPPGAKALTPLTNLAMAEINRTLPAPVAGQSSPISSTAASTASANVATSLGLTGVDLLNTDPVAAAASNPALIRTTSAVQALLSGVSSGIAGGATGPNASATTTIGVTSAVYDNAVQALLASVTATPVTTTVPLSNLASAVVAGTVTRAATNTTVTAAAPGITTLSPTSAAAFLSPTLANSVALVVAAPASVLASTTPSANNPATAAASSGVLLGTSAGLASTLLTTSVAAANPSFAIGGPNNQLTTLNTRVTDAVTANQNAQTQVNANAVATTINNQIASTTPPAGTTLPTVSIAAVNAAAAKTTAINADATAKANAATAAGAAADALTTGATGT